VDISAWLRELGLDRYEEAFRDNEIDAEILPTLTADDLKDLGVTIVGHRRKLLNAITSLEAIELVASTEPPSSFPAQPVTTTPVREAERRQLTVMFCDLVGSTALSAKLDPEDMQDIIRGYQNAAAGEIARFEGHVAKFMGDGVLAYFGYPRAHEDDPERAVRAGLDLIESVSRLTSPDGEPLRCRVGIATGLVVVGDLVGEGGAQEQAVVGDTPNLAARLQALAGPGQIVIAESTRRLLGDLFDLADLGAKNVKGIAEPIRAFAVGGERPVESRFEAMSGPSLLPMVGRNQEQGLLLGRWAQAKAGEGQGVLLVGEAGIGKSRIARALLDAVADQPHTRIRYQCSPYHGDSAFWPVIQQLGRAAGFAGDDSAETRLDKLEALLARAGNAAEAAPLIADLLGLNAGERYGELNLTSQAQRGRTLMALVDQLLGLSAQQPVLMVLEDAHWVDPTTLELMEQCLERIADARVLILLTSRPDGQPALHAHPHVTRLTLNRLGRAGVEAIVARLGGEALPRDVIDTIINRTDGVPLFVEELTKAVVETGETTIPASLQDSLVARLDRLPEGKEIAQIAACIGREFGHSLLAAVVDRPLSDLEAALDRLVVAELIFRRGTPPGVTYAFKHALVQDAAYQSLLKSRRQQLHAHIAEALLERASEDEAASPEVLAHHFTEGSMPERAILHWLEAGERANVRFAIAEAIAHLGKGLDLIERMPDTSDRAKHELALLIALGPPLIISKGLYAAEVHRLYARAEELAEQVGDRAQRFAASWGSWNLVQGRADWKAGPALADKVMILAESARDPDELIQAHHTKWSTHFFRGELTSALPHLAAGRTLYDSKAHRAHTFLYGGHDPGTCCKLIGAMTSALRGFPEQAMAEGVAAVRFARELDNPPNLAYALVFGAHLQQFLRDAPGLLQQAEAGTALASTLGMTPFVKIGELFQGWARMECGAVDEGAAQLAGVLARARERRRPAVMVAYYLCLLAESRGRVGDHTEGLAIFEAASEMMGVTNERLLESELHRLKGELVLGQSREQWAEAEHCFDRALGVARRQEAKLLELRTATSLARLWADRGERRKARDLLAPVYDWFTEGFDTADLKDAKALLAELA
jgi:class 3 adenylate cyclase/predicted ATPase